MKPVQRVFPFSVLSSWIVLRGGHYSSAEKSLNERLEQMPDLVITVLGQFTVAADTEVVSS